MTIFAPEIEAGPRVGRNKASWRRRLETWLPPCRIARPWRVAIDFPRNRNARAAHKFYAGKLIAQIVGAAAAFIGFHAGHRSIKYQRRGASLFLLADAESFSCAARHGIRFIAECRSASDTACR